MGFPGLPALTVESFRELKAENDRLKANDADLSSKLATVEERLAAIERRGGVQHASIVGNGGWLGGVMLGAAFALVPLGLRRRRERGQAR